MNGPAVLQVGRRSNSGSSSFIELVNIKSQHTKTTTWCFFLMSFPWWLWNRCKTERLVQDIKLARRGATILAFGCCPAQGRIEIEPFQIYWKELRLLGSFLNPNSFPEAIRLLDELNAKGWIDLERMGVEKFQLRDFRPALDRLRKGLASKVFFSLGQPWSRSRRAAQPASSSSFSSGSGSSLRRGSFRTWTGTSVRRKALIGSCLAA